MKMVMSMTSAIGRSMPAFSHAIVRALVALALIASPGCSSPKTTDPPAKTPPSPPIERSLFAIEALPPGLQLTVEQRRQFMAIWMQLAAELGVAHAGVNALLWGDFEPDPPANGVHTYNWDVLDDMARAADAEGITLQLDIHSNSPWGTVSQVGTSGAPGSSPVLPAHHDNFKSFVRDLVRRYNGKAGERLADLSGPVIAILNLGSEIEVPQHWPANGTAELPATATAYYDTLAMMKQAAGEVDPTILIMRGPTNFGWFLDGPATPDEVWAGFAAVFGEWSKQARELLTMSSSRKDTFDAFSLHPNYGALSLYHQAVFVRTHLVDVPLVSEDTRSTLVNSDAAAHWPSEDSDDIPDIVQTIDAGPQTPDDPVYAKAYQDFFQAQTHVLVQKVSLAAVSGYRTVFVSTMLDFGPTYPMPQWWYTGLVDLKLWGQGKKEQARRPAFHAYKALIGRLLGAQAVGYENPTGKVHVARFVTGGKNMAIAWSDEPLVADLSSTFSSSATLRIEAFPSVAPQTKLIEQAGQIAALELSAAPLIITEQ